MTRIVIGSRNRVLTTADKDFIEGSRLATKFSGFRDRIEAAEAIVWAWYATDALGRPDIDVTLRGTEAILQGLAPIGLPVVFLSTDAVFSGERGGYREVEQPNPNTAYGRIKLAQEQMLEKAVQLRFTTFGPSFGGRPLLMEMIKTGAVGIDRPRQFFSPISTISLNRCIDELLSTGAAAGVYHLTSERISKSECCRRLAEATGTALPLQRTVDETPLDLSLLSATHTFALDKEIALAAESNE